ncbi:MAG: glycosyltransferase family 2 protein [Proteobacteria bacterium]|nr:glycosyltransferase family 2 protein [Pseudomonadota bacterium]
MASRPGLTSVIIVAADSGSELGPSVASVMASIAPVEVIVGDNASRDGSVEAVARRWAGDARLRIVRNGANLGFGAACNRGAAIAQGDAVLFLNPDCRIEPDTIARLRTLLDPGTGLVGADVVDRGGAAEPASRRRDPLLRRALMSLLGLESVHVAGDATDVQAVDAVSGALMLLPRAAFDLLGGFDEGFFLHCEDIDLCRRVRDAGLRVVCANAVRIVHGKGTSSRARPFFVAYHKHRGMWRWFRKFDPAARNPLARALVWCGLWAHYALLTPRYAWARLNYFVRSR